MAATSPFSPGVLEPRKEALASNEHALRVITGLERSGSILSLLGSLFVIVTFLTSHSFHKPVNRLVFYASFGNLMTNVGTLMSRDFTKDPLSPGCQFQGFLIQMFMPADSLWTLAMAINVYLTFYQKFDAVKLRKMEIPYITFNYGVPFIPAFVYIFVSDSHGHRVYGDATLWCWVTPEWGIWRVLTFYAPVWLVIAVTMFIYLRAGRTIYEKRKQLYNFSEAHSSSNDPYSTSKTTEVSVTTEVVEPATGATPAALAERHRRQRRASHGGHNPGAGAYSVTITADMAQDAQAEAEREREHESNIPPTEPRPTLGNIRASAVGANVAQATRTQRRRNMEMNNAAWSYTKCAILFFTAMLITWIPSSANRVYSVLNDGNVIVGLEYASSFVLPLQGLWNCIIYIVTSWTGCKNYFRELGLAPRERVVETVPLRPDFGMRREGTKRFETESMTELQGGRSSSNE